MNDTRDSDIIISPQKNKNEKEIPAEGIFFVNPTEATLEMGEMKRLKSESRFLFNSQLYLRDETKFIAGPAIGAPMAALTMEKLIALGAKRIILFGWCGALSRDLHIGDVLVPHLALSGEGTSEYYSTEEQQAGPDEGLRGKVVDLFAANEVETHDGCVWSTDAVYREKRSVLTGLHKRGVSAIDMEYSALCSVAKFRGIEFAAVLVVSDEIWGKSWRPGFSSKVFKKKSALARQLLINNNIGMQEK
ncbi:MAG: uridine phosphorylase [Desulfotalea sp.]|nr:MAG: uridine phosphorylase [Desulfotalea sp.]